VKRVGLIAVALAVGAAEAHAQAPQPPPLQLGAPRVVATGVDFAVRGSGAAAGQPIRIEVQLGTRWHPLGSAVADPAGRFAERVRPRRPRRRYTLRAAAPDGRLSAPVVVRSRDVTLAAVGDINLGDGPGLVMRRFGLRYPWTGVARTLRNADIAFGNLECAVSTRGRPVPKEFNFRGRPAALRVVARYAGFDVLNLANNHSGDYGTAALLDTLRYVRRFGMVPVGAGAGLASASAPRVVERLGLKVAFVGFSNILPASFFAGPGRPGSQAATPGAIRRSVRRARRRADVVIATFHWGVERAPREDARQRTFAATALRAGATAVIGAHPHVLQPIRRDGRRLVAYSLGNFVFSATSPATTRTGILRLRLAARGVEGGRLTRAVIEGSRPRLLGRRRPLRMQPVEAEEVVLDR
jgi:poly-gamma-glutamate capsule biosynthesis protein CapA/YwtB (metallophosphatase superfamily)